MLQLRPFQISALAALDLAHPTSLAHVLCVSPTGSGKSLIYEKASAGAKKRTLLVSPLIALAQQQSLRLKKIGITTFLGSGGHRQKPPPYQSGVWIVSPEMLHSPSHLAHLKKWKPNLLVVDECHCLWEWGEHFRPAFSEIPDLISSLQIEKSLWLSATLPYEARIDLKKRVPFPLIEIGQFDLPSHLFVSVKQIEWKDRIQFLLSLLHQQKGAGIIFVPTRQSTVRISKIIQTMGRSVIIYHGGMSKEERRNAEHQIALPNNQVIVATSAFGMGMDHSHLRWVILLQTPTSLLSLVQIIGRVGRNSKSPDKVTLDKATILWDYEDFRLLEWTVMNSPKRKKELRDLIDFLETFTCRRKKLKQYFNNSNELNSCHLCDYCLPEYRPNIN